MKLSPTRNHTASFKTRRLDHFLVSCPRGDARGGVSIRTAIARHARSPRRTLVISSHCASSFNFLAAVHDGDGDTRLPIGSRAFMRAQGASSRGRPLHACEPRGTTHGMTKRRHD